MNSYYTYSSTVSEADAGTFMAFLGAYWLFIMLLSVLMLVAMWKVYVKAGQPGWACLVPIYNIVVMCNIAKVSPWIILAMLIPFVNFIVMIYLYFKLAESFGKGFGFTVGMILLPFVFWPILAFGDAEYIG